MEIRKPNQKLKMKKAPKSENEILIERLSSLEKKLEKAIKLIKPENKD